MDIPLPLLVLALLLIVAVLGVQYLWLRLELLQLRSRERLLRSMLSPHTRQRYRRRRWSPMLLFFLLGMLIALPLLFPPPRL